MFLVDKSNKCKLNVLDKIEDKHLFMIDNDVFCMLFESVLKPFVILFGFTILHDVLKSKQNCLNYFSSLLYYFRPVCELRWHLKPFYLFLKTAVEI